MSEPQMNLLPSSVPSPIYEGELLVAGLLDRLQPVTWGEAPNSSFLNSLQTLGQIEPIVLTVQRGQYALTDDPQHPLVLANPGHLFTLKNGCRRLAALVTLAAETVKVVVYEDDGTWSVDTLTLVTNYQRSHNAASELEAIQRMYAEAKAQGTYLTDRHIAKATGISLARIQQLRKLLGLPAIFLEGIREGRLTTKTAYQVARLGPTDQDAATRILVTEDKLTGVQVKELKAVGIDATVAAMGDAMFTKPVPVDPAETLANGVMAIFKLYMLPATDTQAVRAQVLAYIQGVAQ